MNLSSGFLKIFLGISKKGILRNNSILKRLQECRKVYILISY